MDCRGVLSRVSAGACAVLQSLEGHANHEGDLTLPRALVLVAAIGMTLACGRTDIYRYIEKAPVVDAGLPCIPGSFTLTPATPVVMFVLDRSSSMNSSFGSTGSRWTALTRGLTAALPPIDNTMDVGALLFPAPGAGNACVAPGSANLEPRRGNVGPLLALLVTTRPTGSTPTAVALDNAALSLSSVRAATGARAMVLATDGSPDCNSSLNPKTCTCASGSSCSANICLDDVRTVERVTAHAKAGLPTYVLGIRNAADATFVKVLNRMAVAGGRARVGKTPSYYPATSSEELTDALTSIRSQLGACTFLSSSVPDRDGATVVVLDGQEVAYDDTRTEGWAWGDKAHGEFLFYGSACDALTARPAMQLKADVTCRDSDGGS